MRSAALAAAVMLLAACTRGAPEPEAESTEVPEDIAKQAVPVQAAAGGLGTPMAERVATLGLLNKRNNISRELKMKPGEARREGDVIVRLSACERTAPWEDPPEVGAFAQVLVLERPRNLKVDLRKPGMAVADIGSNDLEFWFANDMAREMIVGQYAQTEGFADPMLASVRPDWVFEILGLEPMPEDVARNVVARER